MANDAAETQSGMVLRKLAARPEGVYTQTPVHRAFRQTICEVAAEEFGLQLTIGGLEDGTVDRDQALSLKMENGLHYMVDGPDERAGLVVLSAPLVRALIEIQTVSVVSGEAEADRPPSRTEAAVLARFVDAVLAGLGGTLEGVKDEEWTQGQRAGPAIFDFHKLALEMPEVDYRQLRATVKLGDELPDGDFLLVLPARPIRSGETKVGAQAIMALEDWAERLTAAVFDSQVTLKAVLHRRDFLVSDLRGLTAGALVPLPPNAENRIRIEGMDGECVARGKIGMMNAMKAVRISVVADGIADMSAPDIDLGQDLDEDPVDPSPMAELGIDLDTPEGLGNLGDLGSASDVGADEPEDGPTEQPVSDLSELLNDAPDLSDLPELDIATPA